MTMWVLLSICFKAAIAVSSLSYNGLVQTPQMGWVSLLLPVAQTHSKVYVALGLAVLCIPITESLPYPHIGALKTTLVTQPNLHHRTHTTPTPWTTTRPLSSPTRTE